MKQSEIDREVAQVTGESRKTISQRGFSLVPSSQQQEPQVIDWDKVESEREILFPVPQRQQARVA